MSSEPEIVVVDADTLERDPSLDDPNPLSPSIAVPPRSVTIFISPECNLSVKVGALADRVGDLANSIATRFSQNRDVFVITPHYSATAPDSSSWTALDPIPSEDMILGPDKQVRVYYRRSPKGVHVIGLAHAMFLAANNTPAGLVYSNKNDNNRFGAFDLAVVLFLLKYNGLVGSAFTIAKASPKLIVTNEWQTGMFPVFFKLMAGGDLKSVTKTCLFLHTPSNDWNGKANEAMYCVNNIASLLEHAGVITPSNGIVTYSFIDGAKKTSDRTLVWKEVADKILSTSGTRAYDINARLSALHRQLAITQQQMKSLGIFLAFFGHGLIASEQSIKKDIQTVSMQLYPALIEEIANQL